MGVDSVEQGVEVAAGELPAERLGHGVVARLERGEPGADLAEVGEFAWTGRWIRWAFGQALRIRLMEAVPRREEPLSTIQNTRLALA